jgi:hypothetical protein
LRVLAFASREHLESLFREGWVMRGWVWMAMVCCGVVFAACEGAPWVEPYPLDQLVLRDSVYHHPDSDQPFTGPVERRFAEDSSMVEVRGVLRDGLWSGELRVYHPNGRIRYMGSLHEGEPCGEWIEEQPPDDPGDWYERFVEEIESLAVYDACP